MAFIKVTSPHVHRQFAGTSRTGTVMLMVALATLPGLVALTWFFGPGSIINVILGITSAVAFEAAILKLRKRPLGFYLTDFSALVTGLLLGLALPPYCPWWLVLVGTFSAIVMAKQLYGGMGFNPFNPAMVGYVVLLISFPLEMSQWPAPSPLLGDGQSLLSVSAALGQVFGTAPVDGYTAATALDIMKQNNSLMLDQLYLNTPQLAQGNLASVGWEWVNIGFLIGGLFLLQQRVFTWHAPLSMLAALALMAAIFYDSGSSASGGSPLFHLLTGATMFGAFFIVTDPVTSAVSTRGRMIYGALIGILIYLIRTWGNYPDAVAFSVLLLNFAAPFIDYYTVPRSYGHSRPRRATEKND